MRSAREILSSVWVIFRILWLILLWRLSTFRVLFEYAVDNTERCRLITVPAYVRICNKFPKVNNKSGLKLLASAAFNQMKVNLQNYEVNPGKDLP